ncbi:MAG: hypothetical protein OQJ80_05480 [Kangiella sp.]|nr:hypothetical protein [Kangiella sp.]
MLKFLRNFIARDVHSHFDIAVYFIALLVARSFLDNGGSHFYALLIMLGMIFVGIYFQVLITSFIDARLKAKAEKALYLEQKRKTNQYNGRDGNGYQPVPPPPRSVTGKPPKKR